ncbi:MAG: phosphoribosylglycinamide formyltransferase [Alphaproteobacteria bacterium]|nr:phosphoribosylglycinamide formyltransferase [Alphaproteobacteria bacterium]
MARVKAGVLISGRGSNLQALIDACAAPDYPAEIAVVISNRPGAAGLDRARAAGIATCVVDHKEFADRQAFEVALDARLRDHAVAIVCNAGFMRILTAFFIDRWRDRQLNIHPSLLPAFPGLHTHERALAAGVRVHGCTVHVPRVEVDGGPILVQAAVPVLPGDTADSLAERVLACEHRIYPLALRLMAEGRVVIEGDVAKIREADWPVGSLLSPSPVRR